MAAAVESEQLTTSNVGRFVDRIPEVPAAGKVFSSPEDRQLLHDVSSSPTNKPGGRRLTPDKVRPFLRDHRYPVGTRPPPRSAPASIAGASVPGGGGSTLPAIYAGSQSEAALQPVTFGVRTRGSESAAALLHGDASRASVQNRLAAIREQATYASAQREPLGKVPIMGVAPPQAQAMIHGRSTDYGESAKALLYTTASNAGSRKAPRKVPAVASSTAAVGGADLGESRAGRSVSFADEVGERRAGNVAEEEEEFEGDPSSETRVLPDGRTVGRLACGEQRRRGYNWDWCLREL
eukprot:TRINITY_DN47200_c0_g1_i1.p1 TRINITY_DN47200_c0_g1~~TRINITY_DN47200_c0_g1_i1.p1  ORF type:complete len:294 (-),score=39.29 TRINITY_DN47200_c0_g1_i1:57-938(-)